MSIEADNCSKCPEFLSGNCDGEATDCMCKRCPRNLGECLTVRYCRETESPVYVDTVNDFNLY